MLPVGQRLPALAPGNVHLLPFLLIINLRAEELCRCSAAPPFIEHETLQENSAAQCQASEPEEAGVGASERRVSRAIVNMLAKGGRARNAKPWEELRGDDYDDAEICPSVSLSPSTLRLEAPPFN